MNNLAEKRLQLQKYAQVTKNKIIEAGTGYETKGFLNPKVVEARIEQAILDNRNPDKLPGEIAEILYTVVDEQK